MTREQILKDLSKMVADKLSDDHPVVELEMDDNLKDRYGLDSLDLIELVVACEKKYGIAIDNDRMDGIDDVQKFVSVIADCLEEC